MKSDADQADPLALEAAAWRVVAHWPGAVPVESSRGISSLSRSLASPMPKKLAVDSRGALLDAVQGESEQRSQSLELRGEVPSFPGPADSERLGKNRPDPEDSPPVSGPSHQSGEFAGSQKEDRLVRSDRAWASLPRSGRTPLLNWAGRDDTVSE